MRFLIVLLLFSGLLISCATVKSQTVLPVGDNRYVIYLRLAALTETEGVEIMRKVAIDTCPVFRKIGESSSIERGWRVKSWVIECTGYQMEQGSQESGQNLFIASSHSTAQYFHSADCQRAKERIPSKYLIYLTREEAINRGLKPCPVCKP